MNRRHLLAALTAVATIGAETTAHADGPNDCRKWWGYDVSPEYITAHASCGSVQDANNKFRVRADIYRRSDGVHFYPVGQWRSCDGGVSATTWIADLYVFVSYTWIVRDIDDVADGC